MKAIDWQSLVDEEVDEEMDEEMDEEKTLTKMNSLLGSSSFLHLLFVRV